MKTPSFLNKNTMFNFFKNNKNENSNLENFDFVDFITNIVGYEKVNSRFFKKNQKKIRLLNNGIMIGMNTSSNAKHKHIITCKIPNCKTQAEVIFELTTLKK